ASKPHGRLDLAECCSRYRPVHDRRQERLEFESPRLRLEAMTTRAFISFEMEDEWALTLLYEHASAAPDEVQFVDYPVRDPWDSAWKSECLVRIGRTRGTIVLIGPTTHESEAVLWEIQETLRQDHQVLGIQIGEDVVYKIPDGVLEADVVGWDSEAIAQRLNAWG
ncbi:MAG: TIR domain-containing protein, partial [Gammaproteobacteria bacterium]